MNIARNGGRRLMVAAFFLSRDNWMEIKIYKYEKNILRLLLPIAYGCVFAAPDGDRT
jgi:hypothetical protein